MIKNLIKKKIGVLGCSLPMLFLAYYLKKKKNLDVTLINNSKNLGGAWQQFNYKGIKIRKQTNVVVPINKLEEKNQKRINSFLKKNFNIKITKITKKIITAHKLKNKFSYNFDIFLKKMSKEKFLKKLLIKKVKLLNNDKVEINNKYIFDFIFMPTYFGIKKIYDNKKILNIENKVIISEHVIAFIKFNQFKNIYYSDFFNNFFDRVQFAQHDKFYSFSARIVRDKKGSSKKKILKELEKVFKKKSILKFNKFKYKNFYRDEDQILELNKINNNKSIAHVDTSSLMTSSIQIMNYFR